jgi:hypothetical protein
VSFSDTHFAERIVFLLWASLIAMLSQLAKQLSDPERIRFVPLLGGLLGSALASFSFAALMVELLSVSNLLVLAMAGPIGWLGGDILASLGKKYLRDADVDQVVERKRRPKRPPTDDTPSPHHRSDDSEGAATPTRDADEDTP